MQSLLAICQLTELTRVRYTTNGAQITVESATTDALGASRWSVYTSADQIKPESEIRALVDALAGQTTTARVLSEVSHGDRVYRLVQLADSDLVVERREADMLGGVAWCACAKYWMELSDEIRGEVAELLVLAIPRQRA